MTLATRPAVLFVCLGNICRSPLAEAAFRLEAGLAGLDADADSAGTGDWHVGNPPDLRAQAVALRHGVDISSYQARQVQPADFERFDWIFALDRDNLSALKRQAPAAPRARLSLLLDMVPGREGEAVADPYFGDEAGFDVTWQDVSAAARALVARLG
jgi:protein-tyrosine phosphatase